MALRKIIFDNITIWHLLCQYIGYCRFMGMELTLSCKTVWKRGIYDVAEDS